MLFYVIAGMLRDSGHKSKPKQSVSFAKVIFTIVAADISMSLDNVIAVLSVVADDAGNITTQGFSIAFLGLAVSVPVLLIASEFIIKLMNRCNALFALCAGYLAYIAANMIFEDEFMELFFAFLRFPYTMHLAIGIGLITAYFAVPSKSLQG